MLTFIIFLLILSILIVVHEFGHFIAAKKCGVKVEKFSLGFGPVLAARKKDDTEYSICALPLGGYVKMAGDNLEEYKGQDFEYLSKRPGKRFWIIFCGPLLNYILGILCFWFVFMFGYPELTNKVGGLLDDFGAKEAGIMVGDVVVAIDGKKTDYWEDIQVALQAKSETSLAKISILRDNKPLDINVAIKEKTITDQLGKEHKISLLGISPAEEIVKVKRPVFQAFVFSLNKTWSLTVLTYRALWGMVTSKLSIREATGPLGIYFLTSKVAQQGFTAVLHFIGLISISLALFNLLPLPVLDGGHIFLLMIEKIRGKYLSLKAENIINQVGFTFIIGLALIVTYNDVVRFFGDKIAKFFVK